MSRTVDRLDGRPAATDTSVDQPGDAAPAPTALSAATDRADRRRRALLAALVAAVVGVPVVVAAIAVRSPRWYPLVDMAQIEWRVRDVGLAHPPLVGLGGRIVGHGVQGSHPGPLSFYLLAPVYRLLGSSAWALQASASVLNVGALAATVWAAHRRLGLRGALLAAAGLALLVRLYGTAVLVYPWNPFLPVLFWVLFLVCVWGVLCDDLPLLPVAVAAGTLCAQTHIPYVALVGGMAVVVVAALGVAFVRRRGDPGPRRSLLIWTGGSLALGLVLWLPVVVEQLGGDPGNLSIIVDNFRHPSEAVLGLGGARPLFLDHLNLVNIVEGHRVLDSSSAPGFALLAAWAISAAATVWRRERTLIALHVVVGAALVMGLAAISRIFGPPWYYLMLWAWGTAVLAMVAVAATALRLVADPLVARLPADRRGAARWAGAGVLGLVVLVPTVLAARTEPDRDFMGAGLSDQVGEVLGPVLRAIEDGEVDGGPDGTFLVTWADPVNLGGQGQGLMLELEREGIDVKAIEAMRLGVRDHRVVEPGEADAEIHLAIGEPAIDEARARPGAAQLAYHDPRTPAERREYDRLTAELTAGLTAAGLTDLVPLIETDMYGLQTDPRMPEELSRLTYFLSITPRPLAVFSAPVQP
jgi:hypothetical protein